MKGTKIYLDSNPKELSKLEGYGEDAIGEKVSSECDKDNSLYKANSSTTIIKQYINQVKAL